MSKEIEFQVNTNAPLVKRHYKQWIQAYVDYHDGKHPVLMGSNELKSYLLFLEYKLHLPVMTIKHAFFALEYLYTKVLDTTIPRFEELSA